MISGAFLLDNDKNSDYKFFYKKCIKSVGIPTFLFSIIYFMFSECLACYQIVLNGGAIFELLTPMVDLIRGEPYYHMWYVYTLLGVYLIIPIIIDFKKRVGEETFKKISFVILPVATLSGWTSKFVLNWGLSKVICYVGLLMIGYQIRRLYKDKQNNRLGILFILLGIIVECIITYIQYGHSLMGIPEANEKYSVVGSFNPLMVLASIMIFAGFAQINIKYDFNRISSQTFYIYLIHALIWEFLMKAIIIMGLERDARIVIPICIFVVFIISYLCSIVYTKLWDKIEKRFSISDKILGVFRLN